jgi:RNA polymerase sigma factor (sigma-70 family)
MPARRDDELVALLGADLARIQRVARAVTGSPDQADELVAEAIARVLPRWRAGRVADPGAYLRRTVVNLAARRWRRRALGSRRDHAALDWLPPARDATLDVVERDRTWRAVLELPVRRRAVVVLRFYEDLPLDRIAVVLGVSEGTVKSQLARGLDQLRRTLGEPKEDT